MSIRCYILSAQALGFGYFHIMKNKQSLDPLKCLQDLYFKHPSEVCVVDGTRVVTYAEFVDAITNAKLKLKRLPDTDLLLIHFQDQLKIIIYGIAALSNGVPIYLRGSANFTKAMSEFESQGKRFHVLHEDGNFKGRGRELFIDDLFDATSDFGQMRPELALSAGLYLTGTGTTNNNSSLLYHRPKDLVSMIRRDSLARSFENKERHLSMISNRFFTGFRRSLAALASGGVVFIPPTKINVPALVNYLNKYDIDHLSGVVIHAEQILGVAGSSDLLCPNLKSFIVSGSNISSRLVNAIRNHITENIFIGYGTNEIGEVAILAPNLMATRTDHSVGYLLDGINAKLHQRDGMTELWLQDKYGSQFYGDQNHQKIWFSPNDVASINENGELSILGRVGDSIFFEGITIAPSQFENQFRNITGVKDVAAFGDLRPQSLGHPVIFLEVEDISAFKKSAVTSVAKLFGRKKNIEAWIGEGLPRSSNGKILKRILKNIIAGNEEKDWTVSNFERVDLGGIKKNG